MFRLDQVSVHDLNTGDQIAVERHCSDLSLLLCSALGGTDGKYFHHGIYDRENLEVIEFHGEDKQNARVQRRHIKDFLFEGLQLYRVVHKNCLPIRKTMRMAEQALNGEIVVPPYNLMSNNCENFATYLKTGNAHSKQVCDAIGWNLNNAAWLGAIVLAAVLIFLYFARK